MKVDLYVFVVERSRGAGVSDYVSSTNSEWGTRWCSLSNEYVFLNVRLEINTNTLQIANFIKMPQSPERRVGL